jgi:mono/diheme cytochrome c family protein
VSFVLFVVSLSGCQGGCAGWNQVFERMINQPKARPYSPSSFFSDGRSMQPPPDDTIAREDVVGNPRLTEGMDQSGYVKDYPLPLSMELLQRGRGRFEIYCAPCHGIRGDSTTPVADKMQLRKPPSLHEERLIALVPGQIYHVIHEGYGLMPSYDTQLPVDDRWAVVAYVKALQLSQGVPIVALPTALQEEAREALR